jgi:hypothetical protein
VLRLAFIAFIVLIGGFVWAGPGILLTPFTPRGFSSVSDGTNTVYFQSRGDLAREMLDAAQQSQAAILEFWDDPVVTSLFDGVRLYLGETPDAYYRLTGNHAGGSAMFGSVIVINLSKVGERHSMVDFIDHEMAHIYLRRRFGYFGKHFSIPMWFDEGTAILIQTKSPFKDRFQSYLEMRPQLFSVRQLRYATDWETMYSVEGGILTGQHYGYVGTFVEYLQQTYGQDKIRSYLGALSMSRHPEVVFEDVFGESLMAAEEHWMTRDKEGGLIPADTELVPLPRVGRVIIKWGIIFGLLLFFALWGFRQACRAVRFVAAKMATVTN